jgi:hypothetical protein
VEDRTSSGLWMELVGNGQTNYQDRAAAVLSLSGVLGAWWGDNASPDRVDLPRRMREFATLAIFETDESFEAPPPAGRGDIGLHFARTRRPGQGIVTGRETSGVLLVLISPKEPSAATRLRDWADFVHIRQIAASSVPGYTMITPYENTGAGPRYLHLYEMDSDDPEATFASMTPIVGARLGPEGSKAFDEWAWHPDLRIEYVNTFKRTGALLRV